jgi:hypothetical protein
MSRATPGKTYGEKVAAEVVRRGGGFGNSVPPTRRPPPLKEHKRLRQHYVSFRVGKTRRYYYFGPLGSMSAQVKYRKWCQYWPAQLTEDSRPKGKWPKVRLLTFQGRTQSIARWAAEVGLKATTIRNRLDVRGWSVERALTTPKQQPTFARPNRRA